MAPLVESVTDRGLPMQNQKNSFFLRGFYIHFIPLCFVLAGLASGAAAPARAGDVDPVLLVAKRPWTHPLYGRAVLIAKSIGNRQHIGFILDKPTRMKLRNEGEDDGALRRLPGSINLVQRAVPGIRMGLLRRHLRWI